MIGEKFDAGKLRMSLLPASALNEILAVLEFGAQKYAPDNWRKVDNLRERYFNAAHRHLSSCWSGERNDSESGLHHLAHCACCIIFILAVDMENK